MKGGWEGEEKLSGEGSAQAGRLNSSRTIA